MILFRKVKISELIWFTPRPPKGGVLSNEQLVKSLLGGVLNNQQLAKVPFRGFRGEITFWIRINC